MSDDSASTALVSLPPLSLYIHIPWCVRKCPYCDFNSHEASVIPEEDYVNALVEDLDQELPAVQGRTLQSIFFGGGTPSLFSERSIAKILAQTEKRIPFASDIEITLEANPGTVEQHKFSGYKSAGVNRLSIGIQSFNDQHLQKLGRIHSSDEAITAVRAAKKAGFDNFNLDLMHGLPEQTQPQALQDLSQALDLGPTHLSWYQLTIEPNTRFYSAPPPLPSIDSLADIQSAGESVLEQCGFHQYEISAYTRDNKPSRHNLNYWLFGDYIGIGAGAHGKISSNSGIARHWKTRSPKDYLQRRGSFSAGHKQLSKGELPLEFMMNALRLNGGFSIETYCQRTGLDYIGIEATVAGLIERRLLEIGDKTIRPSDLGRAFLNDVLAEF